LRSRRSRAGSRSKTATSKLLAGIEAGAATGRAAQAFKPALRRHGAEILKSGGREALAAATDRLSAIPGREAERRAAFPAQHLADPRARLSWSKRLNETGAPRIRLAILRADIERVAAGNCDEQR
jgi:hypothetical protein